MGRAKGSAIRAAIDWYVSGPGEGSADGLYALVPSEQRRHFVVGREYLGILTSSWYDDSLLHALCDVFTQIVPKATSTTKAALGGRESIKTAMSGVHRALFRVFVSPPLYAAHAQRLWNGYYDNGVYEAREVAPTEHAISISMWTSHHPVLCLALHGSTTAIYESMGCKRVRVERLACVSDGEPACRISVQWD